MTKELQKRKRLPFQNLLLRTLVAAGVLSVALIAPKMTRLLKKLDRPARSRAQLYHRISQSIGRLEQAELITVSGAYVNRRIALTAKGEKLLEDLEFGEYAIPKPAFWDGKWRVLMFDISERRRRVRSQLRRLLRGMGFVRLQDSVWVYPYPCDEFVALVRAHLRSGVGEVRLFVAEALESDKILREHFNL